MGGTILIISTGSTTMFVAKNICRLLVLIVVTALTQKLNMLRSSYSIFLAAGCVFGHELDLRGASETKRTGELFQWEFIELENAFVLL